jgi:hypothetical protein
LDSISERKGILDSTPRRLLKTVALAAVGVSAGTVVGSYTDAVVGVSAGAAAAKAAEKMAEITTETAAGLLDIFVLERVTKGWSPRMFFDDRRNCTKWQERSPDNSLIPTKARLR